MSKDEAQPNGLSTQSGYPCTTRAWREAAVTWLESIRMTSHLCIDRDRATLRQGWRDGNHPWPPPREKFAGIRWGSDHPADWAAPTQMLRTCSLDLATAVTGNTKVALLELANLLNERDKDHAGPTQEQVLAYERAELLVTAMEQTGRNPQPGSPVTRTPAAPPTETTSTMFSNLVPKRTDLDEHVERAFDLLRHYCGFLVRTPGSPYDDVCERAMGQLETVLNRWLPLAFDASDPLISGVAAVVGDRPAAVALLRDVDLWKARNDRLVALAERNIPIDLSVPDAILVGRREVQHWRKLLPRIWSKPDGLRYVVEADREIAKAPGGYWSCGVEARPSILGASYSCGATVLTEKTVGNGGKRWPGLSLCEYVFYAQ